MAAISSLQIGGTTYDIYAKSANNAGTATYATSAGAAPFIAHDHSYKLSGNGTAVNVSAGVNFKPSGSNVQFFVSGNDIYISAKDTTGTDTKVTQNSSTENSALPFILKRTTGGNETNTVKYASAATFNPSTRELKIVASNGEDSVSITPAKLGCTYGELSQPYSAYISDVIEVTSYFTNGSAKSACSATSAKNAGTATSAGTAANVNASQWTANSSRYILFGENKASTTVGYDSDLRYNPSTNVLSSKNIKSDYISAGSGIHLYHPNDNVKDIKMNGEGISGNDGIDPIETTWVDIINAANSPINAGVDLKKSGNVISVNTNGSVANSANNDFVIGSSCWVSGYSNFGGGKETKTKGHQNFTFGISSLIYDGSGTMALGQTNSALQENYSFVGGQNSVVESYKGTDPTTMSVVCESEIRPAFAFGYKVSAKGGAVVFGNSNLGVGENSAWYGKSFGGSVANSAIASIVSTNMREGMTWYEATTSGGQGGPFVVGSYNRGYNPGTFVAGISSYGISPASFVACKGNVAVGYAQSVLGKFNSPEEALLTIGAGYSDSNRKNVFSITKDGKFFIGRGVSTTNNNVNDYPDVYVGNTLKLWGNFSAAGSISVGGRIYGVNGMDLSSSLVIHNNNDLILNSGDIIGNYTTYNVNEGQVFLGNKSVISSIKTSNTDQTIIFRTSGVDSQSRQWRNDFSANVTGINYSYSNPGGSYGPKSVTWYDIIEYTTKLPSYFDGSSAKSALSSKLALSSCWSQGTDNVARPIGFANANEQSSWTAGNDFYNEICYDKDFVYNPSNNTLTIPNVSSTVYKGTVAHIQKQTIPTFRPSHGTAGYIHFGSVSCKSTYMNYPFRFEIMGRGYPLYTLELEMKSSNSYTPGINWIVGHTLANTGTNECPNIYYTKHTTTYNGSAMDYYKFWLAKNEAYGELGARIICCEGLSSCAEINDGFSANPASTTAVPLNCTGKGNYYQADSTVNLNTPLLKGENDIFLLKGAGSTATITMSSTLERLNAQRYTIYGIGAGSHTIRISGNSNSYVMVRPGASGTIPANTTITIVLGSNETGSTNVWSTSARQLTLMYDNGYLCTYWNKGT